MTGVQLGLCCMNTVLRSQKPPVFNSRTVILKTFETKGLPFVHEKILANLEDTLTLMDWNHSHGIHVFRLSSEIFPHKTNPRAPVYGYEPYMDLLKKIGAKSKELSQRLTFHPGPYNVVGTPHPEIFEHTVAELKHHADLLDFMELPVDSVIVIHGGGIYKDKEATKDRWCEQFKKLPGNVQSRLVLENCEKNFSIVDCLDVSTRLNIPVVFDTHHYDCYCILHPDEKFLPPSSYIPAILETWDKRGIKPKFHVSEQGSGRLGHHSDYVERLPSYLMDIPLKYEINIDIMIEAKMKEQAVLRLYRKYLVLGKHRPWWLCQPIHPDNCC